MLCHATMIATEIRHEPANHRYALDVQLPDTVVSAVIDYTIAGDTLTITHSEVPERLRGMGVGKVLVEKTMNAIAADAKYRVVPMCAYVRAVVEKSGAWNGILKS
jgi:uncharacterized protein